MRLIVFLLGVNTLFALLPQKVLICGVCKDVEKSLPKTIQIIEQIGSLFEDYRVLVYENNSKDDTPKILKKWEQRNSRLHYVSQRLSKKVLSRQIMNYKTNGRFFKTELIAFARNKVLDAAFANEYTDFPYLIWIDMDFSIFPKIEGILEVFNSQRDWDAVFAYGTDVEGGYWDWYALRDQRYPIGSELLGNFWWYMPKELKLGIADEWYPVLSAFGGCGIYKKSSLQGCRYSGVVDRELYQLYKGVIDFGKKIGHPLILKYLEMNRDVSSFVRIQPSKSFMQKVEDPNIGVFLFDDEMVWRMSTFVYQYPTVCEHVTLHAAMINRGFDKLYINPRLIFIYGDNK